MDIKSLHLSGYNLKHAPYTHVPQDPMCSFLNFPLLRPNFAFSRNFVHDLIIYSICTSVTGQPLSHRQNVNDTLLIALTLHIRNSICNLG